LWDEIILLVNSRKYGGGGGSLAVASMHSASSQIALHELGHSFANCADEYVSYVGQTYTGADPSRPNVDTDPISPKWLPWIDAATPLPTPESPTYSDAVGAFEGACYYSYGIYRPARTCKMKTLGAVFCSVCREAHMVEYFNFVSAVDSVSPPEGDVDLSVPTSFEVVPVPLADLSVSWECDGEPLDGVQETRRDVDTAQFAAPTGSLRSAVRYVGTRIRTVDVEARADWSITSTATTELGTPHWWLASQGLSTDADGDRYDEGDGMDAWAEYVAGTDPHNVTSRLGLTSVDVRTNGQAVVSWLSEEGRSYAILSGSDADCANAWPVALNIPAAPPVNVHTVNVADTTCGFFRIVVQP
jgi:hypothetical protein